MYVLDFPYVIGMGHREYEIYLKLLDGQHELTAEEEQRVDHMYRTALKMQKVRDNRRKGPSVFSTH